MGEKENEREEFIHAIRKFMEMRTLTKQVLNQYYFLVIFGIPES